MLEVCNICRYFILLALLYRVALYFVALLLWCGVVLCGVVWCGVVWCGVVWCGVVWCGVARCGKVWCSGLWCGVVYCIYSFWCCAVFSFLFSSGRTGDDHPIGLCIPQILFHNWEHYLKHSNRIGLLEATRKIKDELMLMGFIVLGYVTIFESSTATSTAANQNEPCVDPPHRLLMIEDSLVRICVPEELDGNVIPCCKLKPELLPGETSIWDTWNDCKDNINTSMSDDLILEEERICDKVALYEWKDKGGYLPAVSSPLLDVSIKYVVSASLPCLPPTL